MCYLPRNTQYLCSKLSITGDQTCKQNQALRPMVATQITGLHVAVRILLLVHSVWPWQVSEFLWFKRLLSDLYIPCQPSASLVQRFQTQFCGQLIFVLGLDILSSNKFRKCIYFIFLSQRVTRHTCLSRSLRSSLLNNA